MVFGSSKPLGGEGIKYIAASGTTGKSVAKKEEKALVDLASAPGDGDEVSLSSKLFAEAPKATKPTPKPTSVKTMIASAIAQDPDGRKTLSAPGLLEFLKNAPLDESAFATV